MIKKLTFCFITFFLSFIYANSNAQVEIPNKNILDKIKDGNTHVIVGDLNFPQSVEYNRVFKKYWTVTKGVDFIKTDEVDGNLVAGDTYISFERFEGTYSQGASFSLLYLNIWTPSEKEIKKQKHSLINSNATSVAKIYLTENTETLVKKVKEKNLADVRYSSAGFYSVYDFDGNGCLLNWSPGIMKNYLQLISTQLQTGKKYSFSDEITDKKQLPLLASQTIYCTTEVLNKMGFFAGVNKIRSEEDKVEEIKKLFEDYQYGYKIITISELEDKIIGDKEPFYYLLFINSSKAGKFLAVVNSGTGEIIYSRCKAMSLNLKSGDLKDLYKAIR